MKPHSEGKTDSFLLHLLIIVKSQNMVTPTCVFYDVFSYLCTVPVTESCLYSGFCWWAITQDLLLAPTEAIPTAQRRLSTFVCGVQQLQWVHFRQQTRNISSHVTDGWNYNINMGLEEYFDDSIFRKDLHFVTLIFLAESFQYFSQFMPFYVHFSSLLIMFLPFLCCMCLHLNIKLQIFNFTNSHCNYWL